jgi:hypothetical protein
LHHRGAGSFSDSLSTLAARLGRRLLRAGEIEHR